MDNYTRSCAIRDEEFNRILENGSADDIASLSVLSMLMLSKALFSYVPKVVDENNIEEISMNEDKSVFPVVGNTHFHFQLSISVDAGANFLQ